MLKLNLVYSCKNAVQCRSNKVAPCFGYIQASLEMRVRCSVNKADRYQKNVWSGLNGCRGVATSCHVEHRLLNLLSPISNNFLHPHLAGSCVLPYRMCTTSLVVSYILSDTSVYYTSFVCCSTSIALLWTLPTLDSNDWIYPPSPS